MACVGGFSTLAKFFTGSGCSGHAAATMAACLGTAARRRLKGSSASVCGCAAALLLARSEASTAAARAAALVGASAGAAVGAPPAGAAARYSPAGRRQGSAKIHSAWDSSSPFRPVQGVDGFSIPYRRAAVKTKSPESFSVALLRHALGGTHFCAQSRDRNSFPLIFPWGQNLALNRTKFGAEPRTRPCGLAHSQRQISLVVSRPSAHVGWTGLFQQPQPGAVQLSGLGYVFSILSLFPRR